MANEANVAAANRRNLSNFIAGINPAVYLFLATLLAIVMANGAMQEHYFSWLGKEINLELGGFKIFEIHGHNMTVAEFINDALMAIFFFLVGLEIKHELVAGSLSSVKSAMLPVIAAVGGMVVPVLIFYAIVDGDLAQRGAAIPMATDIAFSLAVLGLLGDKVPKTVKIFLMALAVVDDIGGILVIAIFYSSHIDYAALISALMFVFFAFFIGRNRITKPAIYYAIFCIVWMLFLCSGIHTTIAGVLVALAIPHKPLYDKRRVLTEAHQLDRLMSDAIDNGKNEHTFLSGGFVRHLLHSRDVLRNTISPVQVMEHQVSGFVNYIILPLFAFANAGITLGVMDTGMILGVPMGIFLGLLVGKTLGIFSFTWLAAKLKVVNYPLGMTNGNLLGVAIFGGIGFTVSLFIANLAYAGAGDMAAELLNEAKLGVFAGTIASGILGYFILKGVLNHEKKHNKGANSPEYIAYLKQSEATH